MSAGPRELQILLQLLRLGAGEESVVERFAGDPALVQLPLGPLMPVQAQFDSPRRATAHFDKERIKVGVVDISI